MSRGLHSLYQLTKIKNNIAYYSYGGSNFSYPYDQNIFQSMDGRIQISLSVLHQDMSIEEIVNALEHQQIQITKNCFYAECNHQGFDLFAIMTINKIIKTYKEEKQLPEKGLWVV